LLVADLDRPSRFWYILARPQWKSWLTIGAFIILAYSLLLVADVGLYLPQLPRFDTVDLSVDNATSRNDSDLYGIPLRSSEGPAICGRIRRFRCTSFACGIAGACLTTFAAALGDASDIADICAGILAVSLCFHLFLTIGGEILIEHGSKAKKRAVDMMIQRTIRENVLGWRYHRRCDSPRS